MQHEICLRRGEAAILLRYYCDACHLCVSEVGLDIYTWNWSVRSKNLYVVIAYTPVENFSCRYEESRFNWCWQGYVGSVGRGDQGGRSRNMNRRLMSR